MGKDPLKVVVKVEISVLLDRHGEFDAGRMERLTMILSNLVNSGMRIFIVSSGAIFLGAKKLGLTTQPEGLIDKQAMAAVGQAELMKLYRRYFEGYNQTVAQVLLTGDIFADKERSTNARNTLEHLSGLEIIPVINENDSVSTEDIEMDDNYYLVREVSDLMDVHLLLIKGRENGIYYLVTRNTSGSFAEIKEKEILDKIHALRKILFAQDYLAMPFPETLNPLIIQS
jgi:glutamate 5-kinase